MGKTRNSRYSSTAGARQTATVRSGLRRRWLAPRSSARKGAMVWMDEAVMKRLSRARLI